MKVQRVCRSVVFILVICFLTACDLRHETQPSVLVVAVEGLSFDSLNCDNEDSGLDGFRVFCNEAVRFSHAFSPSPMTQASLASLMTGLYPFDHGVHHNGSEFLSAKFRTLAEGALGKGYRTIFVSGGPPLWRKSGLAQGFEIFDDAMDLGLGNFYRPAEEVFKLTSNWIDQQGENAPFLAVTFLSDLQFPHIATRTNEGEIREKSPEAQLEEVGESLNNLVRFLKSKRRWNSTHIVLVGLNSLEHRENETEPPPLSLKSASVQVTLFVKPARKERDNIIQWAVDRNVSLVDLSLTMFNWLGLEPAATSIASLRPENLNGVLSQPEPNWSADHLVVSETAWPDWMEGAGLRWSVRQGQFLYIDDVKPLIFNTLTDRLESLPLKFNDPLWNSLNSKVVNLLIEAKTTRWGGMHGHWPDQIAVARELWSGDGFARRPHGDESWVKWYLRRVLARHQWSEVKRLTQENGEPVGAFVAARNLGENPPIPRNPCLRLILGSKLEKSVVYRSECEDEKILALHAWMTAHGDEDRLLAQERFVKVYSLNLMDQEIGKMNYLNDLRWDVDREWPEAPSTLDYVFTLKELEPFAKKTSALLNGKDITL